jgi:prepilin-type N-terminal cleavage/methylation domain-containing protein
MSRRRTEGERGFTLLELLVASAIGAVVIFALYLSFSSVLAGRSAIDERAERTREVERFVDAFSREVQSAYLTGANRATFFKGSLGYGALPSGTIEFTSINYPASGTSGDLVAIRYSVGESEGATASLFKEVWNPYGTGKEHVRVEVIEDIKGFDLAFYNGTSWAGAWDGALEKGAPTAVSAALKIMDRGGEKEVRTIARTMIR